MILAKELSERLAKQAENFARFLYPQGKKSGNEWCVGSLQGEAGNSLKIHLKGLDEDMPIEIETLGGSCDEFSVEVDKDYGVVVLKEF